MKNDEINFEKMRTFLSNKRVKEFLRWLKKDKRRVRLIHKILPVLITKYGKRLSFAEIVKLTKINRTSLALIMKQLKQLKIISDYDAEKIIQLDRDDSITYATHERKEKFFYRYRYQLHDLENSSLTIAAIYGACL